MTQPLPRVVKQPGGPNEYLAYLTGPEMQHLRSNKAAPHHERLPDKGALNTFRGVPLFYDADFGEAGDMGESDMGGDGGGGGWDPGVGRDDRGYMSDHPEYGGGPIGDPGYDPRASEGGGEVIRAANTGGSTGTNTDTNGNGNDSGGGYTGPTEAEIRARRIAEAINSINSLFSGTAGLKQGLIDASYDLSASGIGDAYLKAQRALQFQMLRQGLDTGQPDIDLRADLSKVRSDSLADAMRHAQTVGENWATRRSAKKAGLINQALGGNLMPGQVGGVAGTLSPGVPTAWGGIADIGWNIPTGYAPSGMSGFYPNWQSQDTGAYFGVHS